MTYPSSARFLSWRLSKTGDQGVSIENFLFRGDELPHSTVAYNLASNRAVIAALGIPQKTSSRSEFVDIDVAGLSLLSLRPRMEPCRNKIGERSPFVK